MPFWYYSRQPITVFYDKISEEKILEEKILEEKISEEKILEEKILEEKILIPNGCLTFTKTKLD
jgi:hypothetical protein